ncbi:hypothetical protein [Methanobrevibacter sp.]|uniref:hypothetical protein n=1 Tax=Methanobrevibacter sp. TaxID=66852 RepID=UPI003868F103
MTERFQIIHLGNAYDFVIKDHKTDRTYGTFQGDKESMLEMLDNLNDEIKELQVQLNFIRDLSNSFKRKVIEKNNSIGILKKQIEEYNNPDKYILIEKPENSDYDGEYNSCPDCINYSREYEEIIAFGEYETLTKEICSEGHDIEDTNANKCPDYTYKDYW